MTLFKQIAFAAGLTIVSFLDIASSYAHDTRIGNLVIDHAWSRQSPMAADVAAGFMTITNTGSEDDKLVKATLEITGTVQLHDMQMDGDVMRMREIPAIDIPAGQTVELKPGGLHVMMIDMKGPMKEGDMIPITLTFDDGSSKKVDAKVVKPTAAAMPMGGMGGHDMSQHKH